MIKKFIQPALKIYMACVFSFSSAFAVTTFQSPLIDAQSLSKRLGQVTVLDIRSQKDYNSSHITGAVNSPYQKWRVSRNGVVGLLPEADYVENLIQKAGIDETQSVVVVFGNVKGSDFGSAARVYWTLKVAGLTDIAILDGGFKNWQDSGYETDAQAVTPQISSFTLEKFDDAYLTDAQGVQSSQGDPNVVLLDARPDDQYQGYQKHSKAKYGGTIPDSQQFSQFKVFAEDGTIVNQATLKKLAQGLNFDGQKSIVSFCNTGHWAATNWFVFSELLNYDVKLYDGSMVDWTHKNLEVANQKNRLQLWWHEVSN